MAANCKEPDCTRNSHTRGYCQWHYRRNRRHGTLERIRNTSMIIWAEYQGPTCGVCGRSVYEHGVTEWCHVETRMAQNG